MKYCLYITPFLPYPTGGGSMMRASVALEVLASLYPVIVVHTVWDSEAGRPIVLGRDEAGKAVHFVREDWARDRAAAYFTVSLNQIGEIKSLVRNFIQCQEPGSTLDVVYTFRQHVAPSALSCLDLTVPGPPITILDLDDDDANAKEQFVSLHNAAGDTTRAESVRSAVPRISLFRRVLVTKFQHLLLASPNDCRALAQQSPGRTFTHLPNVVRKPNLSAASGTTANPKQMLFVGTLSYLPNDDAILHFARSILPLIREVDAEMAFRVVGMGRSDRVQALTATPGVTVAGAVTDLAPEYAAAGMLVVPLRAGSGTRIKILEALMHRTPVVSTAKGAEGLAVTSGEHLLIAETPEEFAAACLRLATDTQLRQHLTEQAHQWVEREHSVEAARRVISGCLNRNTAST